MSRPVSVAVAGLGTVGAGVVNVLRANADIIAARAGRPIAARREAGLRPIGLRPHTSEAWIVRIS